MRCVPIKTLAVILSVLFLLAQIAYADDVLVLLSVKTEAYMEILNSAQIAYKGASTKVVNLAELNEIDIRQLVQDSRAKVILAIGDKAYKMSLSSSLNVPVIGAL